MIQSIAMHGKTTLMNRFRENINQYISLDNLDIPEDDSYQIWKKANSSMYEVLQFFVEANHFKDDFEYFHHVGYGLHVLAESKKTKVQYSFLFDRLTYDFSIECYIHNANSIKNLSDKFLTDFFTASEEYKFEFVEKSFFGKEVKAKYADLFMTFKGNIFRMMRNYFIGTSENGKVDELGNWEKSWSIDTPIETIFSEGPIVLKWFYKFNYQLWKAKKKLQ